VAPKKSLSQQKKATFEVEATLSSLSIPSRNSLLFVYLSYPLFLSPPNSLPIYIVDKSRINA